MELGLSEYYKCNSFLGSADINTNVHLFFYKKVATKIEQTMLEVVYIEINCSQKLLKAYKFQKQFRVYKVSNF